MVRPCNQCPAGKLSYLGHVGTAPPPVAYFCSSFAIGGMGEGGGLGGGGLGEGGGGEGGEGGGGGGGGCEGGGGEDHLCSGWGRIGQW